MEDEFIREVDEEYRRERMFEIWRRYSGAIIGAALLLVAAVGGWRFWEHWQLQQAEAAASRYETALRLSRDAKPDESEKELQSVATDAPAGYRLLARFRLAAETGKKDSAAGAKLYDALAADPGIEGTMQDLARLRAAMLRQEAGGGPEVERELERIASPTNPWRHTAREFLGLAGLKRGDTEFAGRWFDQIAADRDTPAGLRARLEIYTALVAGGPVQTTN